MKDKPYIVKTSRGFEVSLPDADKEICVERESTRDGNCYVYLTKEDVLLLLERFD